MGPGGVVRWLPASPQSGGVLEAMSAGSWEAVVEGLSACSTHNRDVCSLPKVSLVSS